MYIRRRSETKSDDSEPPTPDLSSIRADRCAVDDDEEDAEKRRDGKVDWRCAVKEVMRE